MLKTILVAADGSQNASRAVELASYLAARSEADLIVLHVLPHEASEDLLHMAEAEHLVGPALAVPGAVGGPLGGISAVGGGGWSERRPNQSREVVEIMGRQILAQANEVAKAKGVKKVRTIVQDGEPTRAILDSATRESADMIVMGRRGLSDLRGLLMGSVSHKVSHLSDCPCLTVK